MCLKHSKQVNQLNTKIDILEAKLDNMSMRSSGKEDLDKEDEVENVPKWSDYPRTQRKHTITNYSISKSKSGRKN